MAIEYSGKTDAATTQQALAWSGIFRNDPAAKPTAEKVLDDLDIRDGKADNTYYGTDLKGGGPGASNAPKTSPDPANGARAQKNPASAPTPTSGESHMPGPAPSPTQSQAPRPKPGYGPYIVVYMPSSTPHQADGHPNPHHGVAGSGDMTTGTGVPANGTSGNGSRAAPPPYDAPPAYDAPAPGASSSGAPASGAAATGTPINESPKNEPPKTEPPKNATPKNDTPKNDTPKNDTPINGTPGGVDQPATDKNGDPAVVYDSEFDKKLRKLHKTDQPVEGFNYVTKPGAEGADPAEHKPEAPKKPSSGNPASGDPQSESASKELDTLYKKLPEDIKKALDTKYTDDDEGKVRFINEHAGHKGTAPAKEVDISAEEIKTMKKDLGLGLGEEQSIKAFKSAEDFKNSPDQTGMIGGKTIEKFKKNDPAISVNSERFKKATVAKDGEIVEGGKYAFIHDMLERNDWRMNNNLMVKFDKGSKGFLDEKDLSALDRYIEGRAKYDHAVGIAPNPEYSMDKLEKNGGSNPSSALVEQFYMDPNFRTWGITNPADWKVGDDV